MHTAPLHNNMMMMQKCINAMFSYMHINPTYCVIPSISAPIFFLDVKNLVMSYLLVLGNFCARVYLI